MSGRRLARRAVGLAQARGVLQQVARHALRLSMAVSPLSVNTCQLVIAHK